MAFREDESRTREGHAGANLGMLRRVALSLLNSPLKNPIFCAIWNRLRRVASADVHFVPRTHNRRSQRPRTFHSHKTNAKSAPPAPCSTRGLPAPNRDRMTTPRL